MCAAEEYVIAADVPETLSTKDMYIKQSRVGRRPKMYPYAEGLLLISKQHRDELMHDAQRWSLIREARLARRSRRASAHHHDVDAPAVNRPTGTLAACAPRAMEPAR